MRQFYPILPIRSPHQAQGVTTPRHSAQRTTTQGTASDLVTCYTSAQHTGPTYTALRDLIRSGRLATSSSSSSSSVAPGIESDRQTHT
jgi:hypothetical protein